MGAGQHRSEWGAGWPIVLAAFIGSGCGVSLLITAAGLFILPMQREFGWPIALLSLGPVVSLVVALLLPLNGVLIDRFGPRRVAILGFLGFPVSLLLMAMVPASPVVYLALSVLVGVAALGTHSVAFAKCVSAWFRERPGLPLSIMLTGVSAIGIIVLPLLTSIIATWGWRMGFVVLAGIAALPGLVVVVLLMRDRPPELIGPATGPLAAAVEDASEPAFAEVIRTRAFWILFAAIAGAALPIGGVLNHVFVALAGMEFDPAQVGLVASVFAASVAVGRLAAGYLLDTINPYFVGFLYFLGAAAAALAFALCGPGAALAIVAAAAGVLGLAQGAEGSFFAFYLLHVFGRRSYAKAYAVLSMGVSLLVAVGGIVFGMIADHFHSYRPAFLLAVAVFAVSALLMLVLGRVVNYSAASTLREQEGRL